MPDTDPTARAAALAVGARAAEAPATVAALTGEVHSLYRSQPSAEQANCLGYGLLLHTVELADSAHLPPRWHSCETCTVAIRPRRRPCTWPGP